MALPTQADLNALNYSYMGEMFVYTTAKSTINTTDMQWAYMGEPFITNPFETTATLNYGGSLLQLMIG